MIIKIFRYFQRLSSHLNSISNFIIKRIRMSSKTSYHPLKNQEDEPQVSRSKPKMNRLLHYVPQAQDSKQTIKKRCKILHRVSFESKDPSQPLPPSEIRRLTTSLKRLKHLSRLGVSLTSLLNNHKVILRLFEYLKHTKYFSEVHFFSTDPLTYYSKELAFIASQALRSLRVLPKMKIKLSLPFFSSLLNENLHKLLASFNKHKCFTSAHLTFEFCYKTSAVQEIITILTKSKSLSELSLTLKGTNFTQKDSDQLPHDALRALNKFKTVISCRVYFKDCVITNSELKGLVPVLKEAAQNCNLEIIVEIIGKISLISRSEWWWFRRSIRNPNPFHTVHAKHNGELKDLSQKESIALPFIGFIFGYLITHLIMFFVF